MRKTWKYILEQKKEKKERKINIQELLSIIKNICIASNRLAGELKI